MSRIIAGSRGGHRIQTPPGARTRPTADRVREAVFSVVGSWAGNPADLAGLSFIDFYAGSGAIGLEAASRGAHPVTLVESDQRTARLIARNAAQLNLTVTVVTATTARFCCRQVREPVDIAWFDPPYELATEVVTAEVSQLVSSGLLAADGLVIVERATRSTPPSWPKDFDGWSRRYGETTIYYAQRCGEPS